MHYTNDDYSGKSKSNPAKKKGGFGDWLKNAGKDAGDFIRGGGADDTIDTANKALCLINPRRPGCNPETVYVEGGRQGSPWVIIMVVVAIGLALYFILRKKK